MYRGDNWPQLKIWKMSKQSINNRHLDVNNRSNIKKKKNSGTVNFNIQKNFLIFFAKDTVNYIAKILIFRLMKLQMFYKLGHTFIS